MRSFFSEPYEVPKFYSFPPKNSQSTLSLDEFTLECGSGASMSPQVAIGIGSAFLLLLILCVAYCDFFERYSKKSELMLWACYLGYFSIAVSPPYFYLSVFQVDFGIAYCISFAVGLLYTVLDPFVVIGHNLFFEEADPINMREGRKKLRVRNFYQGAAAPHVFFTFSLQIILFMFYASSVWENGRPCFDQLRQYHFYVVGTIVIGLHCSMEYFVNIHAGNLQNNNQYWMETLYALRKGWKVKVNTYGRQHMERRGMSPNDNRRPIRSYYATYEGRYYTSSEIGMKGWYCRLIMSVIVNGYLTWTIRTLLILQVAQSPHALDFVLNFVAAAFIVKLDDYSNWGVRDGYIEVFPPVEFVDLESPHGVRVIAEP